MVDTDEPGWSEEVPTSDGGVEQLWLEQPLNELLAAKAPGHVFVSGCVRNQGRFYRDFDAVILLSAPAEVILDRIATRTSNTFGKAPGERERVLSDLYQVEPLLRASRTIEIDTDRPLRAVVDAVETFAAGAAASGATE